MDDVFRMLQVHYNFIMNKNGNLKKLASAITLLLWSVIALSSFYITQRPLAVQVAGGIISTLWPGLRPERVVVDVDELLRRRRVALGDVGGAELAPGALDLGLGRRAGQLDED